MILLCAFGIFLLLQLPFALEKVSYGILRDVIDPNLDMSVGLLEVQAAASVSQCGAICGITFFCTSIEFNVDNGTCSLFYMRKWKSRSLKQPMYSWKKECSGSSSIANTCIDVVVNPEYDHNNAELYCQDKGGHLLSVFDDESREEIFGILSTVITPPRYWVSGRRLGSTDVFINWNGMVIPLPDEDFFFLPEDCALISINDISTQDWICSLTEKFICQF